MRTVAIVAGAIILGAVTHVNIEAGPGYLTPQSWLMLAIAAGVGVAAFVVGHAWEGNRRGLAVGLVLAVAVGELFNLTATAERLVAGREASQAPVLANVKSEADARKRVVDAGTALKAAQALKATADKAVLEKASERGCLANCRQLLQKAVDDAGAEVTAARADLKAAETALGSIKPPQSATPLADRLGLPPWSIDLFHSAMGSIAANGLAFLLIAFGAHRARAVVEVVPVRDDEPRPQKASPRRQPSKALPSPARDHAARFGMARLCPGEGATELARIRAAYRDWATAEVGAPLPDAEIAPALAAMFAKAGIEMDRDAAGKAVVLGVALKGWKA